MKKVNVLDEMSVPSINYCLTANPSNSIMDCLLQQIPQLLNSILGTFAFHKLTDSLLKIITIFRSFLIIIDRRIAVWTDSMGRLHKSHNLYAIVKAKCHLVGDNKLKSIN